MSYMQFLIYGVGGVVAAGMALLIAFQERLVYVPVLPGLARSYPITPARLRLKYEDVWLRASDGVRLHAWFIQHVPHRAGLFFAESFSLVVYSFAFFGIITSLDLFSVHWLTSLCQFCHVKF